VLAEMERQVQVFADALAFEHAQCVKGQLDALRSAMQPQVGERDVSYDQDVVYFGDASALIMKIRRGAVLCVELVPLDDVSREMFLMSRYVQDSPKELIVNDLANVERAAKVLRASNGRKITVTVPKRGVKAALLRLCADNYAYRVGVGSGKSRIC